VISGGANNDTGKSSDIRPHAGATPISRRLVADHLALDRKQVATAGRFNEDVDVADSSDVVRAAALTERYPFRQSSRGEMSCRNRRSRARTMLMIPPAEHYAI
jgi:hypothetical protein